MTEQWTWVPSPGVQFRLYVDGLSLLFVIPVLRVGALTMAYCGRSLDERQAHRRRYGLLTPFGTAMLGAVLAGDRSRSSSSGR